MPSGLRRRIRSTSRAKSFWPYRVTWTSRVEGHQRDVLRVRHRVQELDRGAAREADALLHAAAGVEQQPEVQVDGRLGLVAAREQRDLLPHAVLEHLEVVAAQARWPVRPSCRSRSRRSWPCRRRCGTPGRAARPPAPASRAPTAAMRILTLRRSSGESPRGTILQRPAGPASDRRRQHSRRTLLAGRIMPDCCHDCARSRPAGAAAVRCLAVCHTELVIRVLEQVLPPSFDVDFLVESRPLARRLHDAGVAIVAGDLRKTDTYLKADVSPSTCIIVEDTGKPGPEAPDPGDARRRARR